MNANARRQAIWHTLCARRLVTVPYLAARYRVSQNTVKEDISLLSLSYPIVTVRGRNGGVKMFNMYPMAVYSLLILDFRNTLQNVLIGPGRKTRPERPIENHTTKGVENDIIAEKREVWYNSIAAAVRITP